MALFFSSSLRVVRSLAVWICSGQCKNGATTAKYKSAIDCLRHALKQKEMSLCLKVASTNSFKWSKLVNRTSHPTPKIDDTKMPINAYCWKSTNFSERVDSQSNKILGKVPTKQTRRAQILSWATCQLVLRHTEEQQEQTVSLRSGENDKRQWNRNEHENTHKMNETYTEQWTLACIFLISRHARQVIAVANLRDSLRAKPKREHKGQSLRSKNTRWSSGQRWSAEKRSKRQRCHCGSAHVRR